MTTISCTSFFPSKPLGCFGDGGACFTQNDELALRMRRIRTHGQEKRYHHQIVGLNSRLDTLQAAILLAKLEIFDDEVELRKKVAKYYDDNISEALKELVVLPYIESFNSSVYAQYTIQLDNRERIQEKLQLHGIPTAVHYPVPLNLQEAFRYLEQPEGSFPIAESVARRVMSLPMHPYLSSNEQDFIISMLNDAVSTAI